ncbi:3-isopropylmalate dehydratase small subunit [Stieleria varia]|uniref:3-isopropylmalate dehydratase small subunit n=1 Tax=Stieleria varia TaxID=2528005 RepID=A0A5C6B2C2_9BACT|nr:3-isopropylmalate dehydratase small subunit [Stieleria varia]TWU04544.1 3-isopropylmalate dehydratase small subunit 1 [Stieleria varia]
MQKFIAHTGLVVTMNRANVDTDQIIPKQFLKRIERTGFGQYLFYDWRFQDDGTTPRTEFELNRPEVEGATILVARKNFGSGSSREHAVWALDDYGFRSVIAPSFADIFYNNCFKNGVLPIVLPEADIDTIFQKAEQPGYQLTVDLDNQVVRDESGWECKFDIDPSRRENMINGLDDIAQTLMHEEKISAYEAARTW